MIVSAPGAEDLRRSADQLAARLPSALAPAARLAFNYRWSWTPGGDALFAAIDADRWERCGHNPVRLLQEAPTLAIERTAADSGWVRRAYQLEESIAADASQTGLASGFDPLHPIAFLCLEYGVHGSLPIYAGGLGVLAGDILKAASDMGLPMIALGLLYRQGYFRQRMDASGWQHEYWVDVDSPRLPGALVTRDGLEPLTFNVPIRGRDVVTQVWRFDVGRVPLYLLDTDRPDNQPIDRWITSRLYAASRETRLAQYALLGLGGVRALTALGVEPSTMHLNEGHVALAPLEWAAASVEKGAGFAEAFAAARNRTVFTTHTPVEAGNETYSADEMKRVLSGLETRLGIDWGKLLGLARVNDDDHNESPGMTPLGLRATRSANGVSARHGQVARQIWRPLFGAANADDVPIAAVTNGVHLPTWMAEPVRDVLGHHLGRGWETRTCLPEIWERIADVPDAELWQVRCRLRAEMVERVRNRATLDRLARGEAEDYVEMAARAFHPDRLTLGFARRLATYKRLHLLSHDLQRALNLLRGPRAVQILLAGKAHPLDDGAKRVVQQLFEFRRAPHVGERIAYLHDYGMQLASTLVSGCDVWLNLPRPPLEASGTSGIKAALNGSLNVSVLDGWWAEAFDGRNGWGIGGEMEAGDGGHEAQDARDAAAVLEILEKEVVPLFYERDADGVPRAWMQRVKASIRTAGLHFTAHRMVRDYAESIYRPGV